MYTCTYIGSVNGEAILADHIHLSIRGIIAYARGLLIICMPNQWFSFVVDLVGFKW